MVRPPPFGWLLSPSRFEMFALDFLFQVRENSHKYAGQIAPNWPTSGGQHCSQSRHPFLALFVPGWCCFPAPIRFVGGGAFSPSSSHPPPRHGPCSREYWFSRENLMEKKQHTLGSGCRPDRVIVARVHPTGIAHTFLHF